MLTQNIKLNKENIKDGYVTIPLKSNFSTETQQYENIEKNFNLSNGDIINTTINYEKIKLAPINDNLTLIPDSLKINLHFYLDNGWDTNTTKLTDIGFSEDDIAKKKNKISKSFLRLSFYDSSDFKTQNLLDYSTIFIDSDELYSKYLLDNLQTSGITCDFFIQNPKLTNKIKSFEGFNIYLFKDDLNKNDTKTIYMKAEFNNASSGRSILFIKNKPVSNNGYSMKELYENLYFEIKCQYIESFKKYTYKFTGFNESSYNNQYDKNIQNSIVLDMYQAKVI